MGKSKAKKSGAVKGQVIQPGQGHFGIRAKQDQLLIMARKAMPGPKALKHIAVLRYEIDWQIDGYRNVLKILSDTTYQDRKHFLLELIQNADDAQFSNQEAKLIFAILDEGLELHYNERGFSIEDVIAITGAGVSTKVGKTRLAHSFIGEKGIGFKSVFALAESVEIESPPWHFSLHKDRCIVPKVLNSGRMNKGDGTRLMVRFSDPGVLDDITTELYRYVNGLVESFLFLQQLSGFRVEDHRKSPPEVLELTIQPPDRSNDKLLLTADPGSIAREYVLYKEVVEFPAALVAERWDKLGLDTGPLKRQLVAAALADANEDLVLEGRLFCFLPTEVTLPVPIFLQVDGHTTADRGRLHDPQRNRWNEFLIKMLPEFLHRAILSWRSEPSVAEQLPVYIPLLTGKDQLTDVFVHLVEILMESPWVRSVDHTWVSPKKAVIATPVWEEWFESFPGFRKKVESVIGKKFLLPRWNANKEWSEKLTHYGVREIDEDQIITILENVKLPREILKQDEELIKLYKYLLELPVFKEHDKVHKYSGPIERIKYEELKDRLVRVPIYPFKDKGFGPLDTGDETVKVFWLSGASRRKTGLEDTINFRIIDINYTYDPKIEVDASLEKRSKAETIKRRNEVFRKLLNRLDVKELTDESILSELQIPWLVGQGPNDYENATRRVEVLSAIFGAYRVKRNLDDDYLKLLSKLSKAFFPAASGNLCHLVEMVLPEALRLKPVDELYGRSGLEALNLPVNFLEPQLSKAKKVKVNRSKKLLEEWRQFLIQCGIRNSPEFLLYHGRFNTSYEFKDGCEVYYDLWQKEHNATHTYSRAVELVTVDIDKGTQNLVCNPEECSSIIAEELYKEWFRTFHKTINLYYPKKWGLKRRYVDPPAGFFLIKYFYYENLYTLVKDTKWGGIEKGMVPVKTLAGKIVRAKQALRVPLASKQGLLIASRYFDFVPEDDHNEAGYHSAYLDSLDINKPEIAIINNLWDRADQKNYPEIMKCIIELLEIGISSTGLEIYDKTTGVLRPAMEFRMGRREAKNVPLIEKQYGEVGQKLGEMIGLPEENNSQSYFGLFEKILASEPDELEGFSDDLSRLLRHWQIWDAGSRGLIANDYENALNKFGIESPPVIVLNDMERLTRLTAAGIFTIGLIVEENEIYGIKQSIRELGLLLPEETGKLEAFAASPLDSMELNTLNLLFKVYAKSLESGERSKLYSLLAMHSNFESLGRRVYRTEALTRLLGNKGQVSLNIPLPYQDHHSQQFYVSLNDSVEQILARILSYFGFTRYKSALYEINDLPIQRTVVSGREKSVKACGASSTGGEGHDINNIVTITGGCYSGTSVKAVAGLVKDGLADNNHFQMPGGPEENWNTGLTPDEEEEIKINLGVEVVTTLQKGPEIYERKFRKRRNRNGKDGFCENEKLLDPGSINPRAFLESEYGGRCQICGIILNLQNGSKYFEVFHIQKPGKVWWADRPFNILSFCPNCHALASHGGRDMNSLYDNSKLSLQGHFFPEEVEQFRGDFYVVPVKINEHDMELKVSKLHMSYFVVLFETKENEDEVAAVE